MKEGYLLPRRLHVKLSTFAENPLYICVCVRACVRARARARVCVCVCIHKKACLRECRKMSLFRSTVFFVLVETVRSAMSRKYLFIKSRYAVCPILLICEPKLRALITRSRDPTAAIMVLTMHISINSC